MLRLLITLTGKEEGAISNKPNKSDLSDLGNTPYLSSMGENTGSFPQHDSAEFSDDEDDVPAVDEKGSRASLRQPLSYM